MKINYNETNGCYELLNWCNGWVETGYSFSTEEEAIDYCNENGYNIEA